jgi:hypothetical protein
MVQAVRDRIVAVGRSVWGVVRPVLGWACILVGIAGIFLPVLQGSIFLVIGVSLVGRRNKIIRWSIVHGKLVLRRWAALPTPVIGTLGQVAVRIQQESSRQMRRLALAWRARQQARRQARQQTPPCCQRSPGSP